MDDPNAPTKLVLVPTLAMEGTRSCSLLNRNPIASENSEPMNPQLLSLFAHVARTQSFTESAHALGVSRPAISARIRQLEAEFGVVLLERAGRGIRLTPAGSNLLVHAERIAQAVADAKQCLEPFRNSRGGALRVAVGHTFGHLDLHGWLSQFQKVAPGVSVEPLICNTGETIEHLMAGRVDLGFVGNPPNLSSICEEHLYDEELVFSCDHSINQATADVIIRSNAFLVREKKSGTRTLVEELLQSFRMAPKKWLELANEHAILQAVKMGLGVAALPRRMVADNLRSRRLTVLNLTKKPVLMPCKLVYSKSKGLSEVGRAFADVIASSTQRL